MSRSDWLPSRRDAQLTMADSWDEAIHNVETLRATSLQYNAPRFYNPALHTGLSISNPACLVTCN